MMSSGPTRAQRLFAGWSANLVQIVLGTSQQVLLIPVFLHFWSSDMLAGWLAIYAAGNLALAADAGLQTRAINRFLAFKATSDSDGRTREFYSAMVRTYFAFIGLIAIALVLVALLLQPSRILGFQAVPHFDAAFLVMTVGSLALLPANLVSALYRVRGNYGRVVWFQNGAMLAIQVAQPLAAAAGGGLLAVSTAYVMLELLTFAYLIIVDVPHLFPFLRGSGGRQSWHWHVGQLRLAFPFGVASITEIALLNTPVLIVSAFVSDRVAVAQWALMRVIAGFVRMLCTQLTLPLAAELGHDRAIGALEQLRSLYARGSVMVTLVASLVVSGLLAFSQDFFTLWTHGAVPYAPALALTLLIGAQVVAPSILALGYANYSGRGELLARTKGLQLVAFVILSFALTPRLGAFGAALAMVATDLSIQLGILASIILWQTLNSPKKHIAFLAVLMALVTAFGWGLGSVIHALLPLSGFRQFISECTLWLIVVGFVVSPLASARLRLNLSELIPT
jgi:O-antigen/teichoic acid export membrane protein